jgi:hypothetical protein
VQRQSAKDESAVSPFNEHFSRTACDLVATGCTSDANFLNAVNDRSSALARMRAAAKTPEYAAASTLLSLRGLGDGVPLAASLARLTEALRVDFLTCCRAAAIGNRPPGGCPSNVLLHKALSLPLPAAGVDAVKSPSVLAVAFGVTKSDVEFKTSRDAAFNFDVKWHRPQLRVLVALANRPSTRPRNAVVDNKDPVVLAAYQETAKGVTYKKRARGLLRVGGTYLPTLRSNAVELHSNAVMCDKFLRENNDALNQVGDQCGVITDDIQCYCFAVRASRNRIKVMRVRVPADRSREFLAFIEAVEPLLRRQSQEGLPQ